LREEPDGITWSTPFTWRLVKIVWANAAGARARMRAEVFIFFRDIGQVENNS
jgi:hypothetical protein